MAFLLLGLAVIVGAGASLGVGMTTGSWLWAFIAYSAGGSLFLASILVGTAVVSGLRHRPAPCQAVSVHGRRHPSAAL